MKIDDLRKSSNIEDRRGQSSSGSSFSAGSSGGNLLLGLLFSRLGWKGKLIVLVVLLAFGGMSNLGGLLSPSTSSNPYQSSQVTTTGTSVSDADAEFMSKVLGTTEDFWTQEFANNGYTYDAPTLVFYTDQTQTGCGTGSAQAGPFYCSADRKIYIDTSFYQELSNKYNAAGDFAMAYVIAHEVGHHVQNELGTLGAYHQKRAQLSDKEGNALNVRLELQADYYAGAWAKYVEGQGLLDIGDIEEAMNAAHAVGDDTLQQEAYGRTVPDSFTHGTSAQRKKWFDLGYTYGDIAHGDTFSVANP
ncbi:TPA: neutral zinc metallopeptidase [Streptococcus suis]|nr:neutral zinc metallopeptidase [Streptococcus suis]MDW8759885.1 neutral zinc metallopeptidase [Streptococcus suis]HEM5997440.1 neutral zinc metallopeptidase [Streptococcus suis]HEM6083001.1 neutral zinc metallopeptidase [Streptococcus suis]HEM6089388.1 neutral zinc metallopeptidase [Streptococcus suis]